MQIHLLTIQKYIFEMEFEIKQILSDIISAVEIKENSSNTLNENYNKYKYTDVINITSLFKGI